jgi:hypothetical protein
MSQYLLSERIDMLEQYLSHGKSVTRASRALRSLWNLGSHLRTPSYNAFKRVYDNFKRFGKVFAPRERNRTVRTPLTIERVRELAEGASASGQSLSSRRIGAQAGISGSTALKILKKDLGLKPYHIRLIHKLNEDDFDRRVEFCETLLERVAEEPDVIDRIIWSDEAIFSLSETVNRHNCVYWEAENSGHFQECDNLGSEKVMVWCGIWSGGRIGPF